MHQDIDWSLAEADHVDFHGIWELDVDFQLVRLADADYPLMGCVRWSLACTDCVAVPIPIPIPIAPIVAVAMRRSIAIVFVCDYLFEEKLINILKTYIEDVVTQLGTLGLPTDLLRLSQAKEEFDVLLTLVRCDMIFPCSICFIS